MKIHVCGAGGEVTGSCYLVQTSQARVLVDMGMFQGYAKADEKNESLGAVEPAQLDAAVLTHAHIDHAGRLPMLPARGLRCPVHCTPATADLARILLADAANIQAMDTERENRKRERRGEPPIEPLFTDSDVEAVCNRFNPLPYGELRQIAHGVKIRLVDAGHILGSASLEMTVQENGSTKTIIFSGDIGQSHVPLLADPVTFDHADVVFMESTYGDRDHRPLQQTVDEFREIIKQAAWNKSKVLIPAFAVGRTQLLLYYLTEMLREGSIPDIPIYLDSPMAIRATELYGKHQGILDADTRRRHGEIRRGFERVNYLVTPAESRALNERWDPAIIIAGSGMCDAGRILHHLKHNLWRKGVSVVLVGFMSQGSLGRRLIDGAERVRIHGEDILVRARIHTLGGLSAHAGQSALLDWFKPMAASRPMVVLTHGEDRARTPLAEKLRTRHGVDVRLPVNGDVIDLSARPA
ncbi:MAG: MBL fold metallo-hydrolase RNA specificity domain-containing protein [bacterium]